MKTTLILLLLTAFTQIQTTKRSTLRVIIIGEGHANLEFQSNCILERHPIPKQGATEDTIEVGMPLGINEFWVHFPDQRMPMKVIKVDSLQTIRIMLVKKI
jgi:hypothetical protein